MISLQKILTHITLIALLFSNTGSFVFAEEEVLHSLNELPSMQEETFRELPQEEVETDEDLRLLSDLIAEKTYYDAAHTEIEAIETENFSIIGSALAEEHEMYLAESTLAFTPGVLPTLTPGFMTNPFTLTSTTGSVFENFITGYESAGVETETIEKDGKKYAKKERKVAGTKGTITAKIPEGTIITTAEGELISESVLDIVSLETEKKTKAQKKYEKTMKNRGNKKKGQAQASPEGFDFGIAGKHLIFSQPIAITIATPHMTDGMAVDLLTMHTGDADFHTDGLSVDATTLCNTDGTASIPGSQAVVDGGKITFYTCGASSFTMNPSGGTLGSNDLRAIIGDCAQVQLYYNNQLQVYNTAPPATGCAGTSPGSWAMLRIGGTTYGNGVDGVVATAWTTNTTTGVTVGNTYTATTTMTRVVGTLTYTLIIDWSHTAPNKYLTWSYRVIIPATNTANVKFYMGNDSSVAGADANDAGYYTMTGGQTVGVYDSTANVLSAYRYISGPAWTSYEAGLWNTFYQKINTGVNFPNTAVATGDLAFGVNWDFGITPGTYSGTLEWRVTPYVAASVPDLIPGIGQPEGPLTTGFVSQMPITLSNIGNLSSSGVHTAILTIPANITGPASAFTDNGWSCGAQVGTTVTCTKTTTIAPLADDTFRIPVIPQPAAGGTNVTFNLSISNPGDSNPGNNTAFATNAVVAAAPAIAPGGVTGAGFWSKADGGKNCTTTGCTITIWSNSGTVGAAANAVTGLGTVTYDPATQINYNPTLYFNNASLNINNNLALPTRANSIFVVSRIGAGGNFYIGTQTATNNARSWRTSPTTDQWMRYNSTVFYNGANNRAANLPAITSTIRQAAGASAGYTNGRSLLTSASNLVFTVNNLGIGRNAATNSTLSSVAEVIIYNTAITATQQNQVESYLAIKYGITLDQTTAKNYIFANGTTTSWNAALAGAYNRDIAGVARDDLASLNQVKSQSINNPGDIIVNTVGAIGSNARALIWGNNGTATGTFSTTDAPTGYQRIDREWQFQEKNGDVGNVKISYPTSSLPLGAGSPIYMLVDSDGTFAAGATAYTGTLVGGNWEWTINMADMGIITFAQSGDITPPTVSSASIASGALIPHGNFSLTYNYTDVGSGINPATATGQIYSWNTGTLSYNAVPLSGYMTLGSSNATSATMNIANLPHGRYRFDLIISDLAGNTTTRSFTYFVDAIEWTISADNYNIGNIVQNVATFGSGELTVTVRTVGAGFSLTTTPVSILARPTLETINYWNGTFGAGYDIWSGGAFGGTILTYSPNATLATVIKNINQNGEKNTFTYRIKYGANVDFMQAAGDYNGSVSFALALDY